MKLKHFWSAAAVIWGCIALGHDHETGGGYLEISCPVGPCSMECQAYGRCLVKCLTGGICPSEGDTTCPTERRLWVLCLEDNQITMPPGPFGGIIIGGPVTPPSNECGDDEIGGGDEECTKCGPGKVPNGDGTACVACDWGESSQEPGSCICDDESVDAIAAGLRYIPQNPWEEAEKYLCMGAAPSVSPSTRSTKGQEDVCATNMKPNWIVGSLAVGHSHPYFDPVLDYSGDKSVKCGPVVIDSGQAAIAANYHLSVLSTVDKSLAEKLTIPVYLVVPHRTEVIVYRQDAAGEWREEIVWREE